MSATQAKGLFLKLRLLIKTVDFSETIFPFHLLGLKGLIGVIANFFEFKDNIGPCTERLYAVLPAGVEIRTPSPISFFIIFFPSTLRLNEAVCLLCLNKETSLMAINFFIFLSFVFAMTSNGLIFIIFAFVILFLIF